MKNGRILYKLSLVIAFGLALANHAHAQLDEIVVTAQKRTQSQQDVGVTMQAFAGDDIKELNVGATEDVAALIPNVQVNYGFGQISFNVRGLGINEFSANLDSPVAVHVDEVYMSKNFMTGLTLFDIERVEGLKGPQGTIFGRNTTGGAINFYTRRPTDELASGFTLEYGNYDTLKGEGYVSGPINDVLSYRLSAMVQDQREGHYDNLTLNKDGGRVDKNAFRGQLQWDLDATRVLASIHFGKDDSELPPYEGVGIFTPESVADDIVDESVQARSRGNIFYSVKAYHEQPNKAVLREHRLVHLLKKDFFNYIAIF